MTYPYIEVKSKTYPYVEVKTQNLIIKNAINFCLENFFTIRYDTYLRTFLYSITYQKLVFYAGISLTIML